MSNPVGWQQVVPHVLAAGSAVRHAPPFDEQVRARHVDNEVAAAGRTPWWPLAAAVAALVLPNGVVWAGVCVAAWAGLAVHARRRGAARATELAQETTRLRERASQEAHYLGSVRIMADRGDLESLRALLDRWRRTRPAAIAGVDLHLENRASVGERGDWRLVGQGLPRSAVPAGVPRAGRGGRTVLDKRPATAIDEDLVELNAAAVLAALGAIFAGDTPHRVTVRLGVQTDGAAAPMPWVTMAALVDRYSLAAAMARGGAPSDAVRALGGDVGRCRAQRYTAAREPAFAPERAPGYGAGAGPVPLPPTLRTATLDHTPATAPGSNQPAPPAAPAPVRHDLYTGRAVTFGDEVAAGTAPWIRAGAVPPPPAGRGKPSGAADGASAVPTPANVTGAFSVVARRFADYTGDSSARFVAFQHYWATYADMAPGQLEFYFKWRYGVRGGQAPRTDLSYVFVHVYELLHGVGANGPRDAARQLERLWAAYRPTYPQLDGYLVPWTADLLALEVDAPAALAWIERAAAAGVPLRGDELRVVTDRHWAAGDYAGMPRASLALLTGDARIGDNKFYQQYDVGPDGAGWIERVYRDAMTVADRVAAAAEGGTPRELLVRQGRLTRVAREPFQSAVYDWPRKPVVLGTVADLLDAAPTIRTYRNAVRYAENLLRAEKRFGAKLRGVELNPALAAALDAHVAAYVGATRPKARVTIDLDRVRTLARESDDVRARLLAGLNGVVEVSDTAQDLRRVPASVKDATERPGHAGAARAVLESVTPPAEPPANMPDGLLTDLAVVQAALAALTAPARRLLEAFEACGWEAGATSAALAAAAQGALVAPLVDEINERAVDAVGDVLIVQEDDRFVLQDDFRDEVYWVLHGTLDGFGADAVSLVDPAGGAPTVAVSTPATPKPGTAPVLGTDGFGPTELRVLSLLSGTPGGATVAAYAADHATTPLLLLDRVNEAALGSSYGDLVVDLDATPPALFPDAAPYVADLLARAHAAAPAPTSSLAS